MKDSKIEDLAEARLMESIVHPNIMQTYRHATRFKEACSATTKMKYDNAISNQSGILLETWLLLEFCNKGSLQVGWRDNELCEHRNYYCHWPFKLTVKL